MLQKLKRLGSYLIIIVLLPYVITVFMNGQAVPASKTVDTMQVKTERDGKEMDVKCCGCRDESSWTEAVLFDKNGAELCCSEPADEYDGTWTLENEGVEYIVYIAVEK